MSLLRKLRERRRRRVLRVRSRQESRGQKIRISVFRSLNHIYAQVIDDNKQVTLASYSSQQLKNTAGAKADLAKKVGLELGKLAIEKNLTNVFFDRGPYLYHGRIKALVEGLREAGLNL